MSAPINVLKATAQQKEAIEAMTFPGGARITFIADAEGNFVTDLGNTTDLSYQAAWPLLAELEEVPYNPAPPPE